MDKAPDAFRTISEVADDLDVPAHVLRFWETRFVQIKPMKRSGGRRYYRPDDVDLLRGIRRLLYGEGYTIRGVQRILREHGIKAVQGIADESTLAPAALGGSPFNGAGEKADERGAAPGRDGTRDDAQDDTRDDIRDHREDRRAAKDGSESDDFDADADEGGEDEREDVEAAHDGITVRPMRAAMDFVPATERLAEPVMARPAAARGGQPPVTAQPPIRTAAMPPPANPAPVRPVGKATAWSGVEAYAPPKIRNGMRSGDRGKLQAVLDDLVDARELIDRVLRDEGSDS